MRKARPAEPKAARTQTDESLGTERSKTDLSLQKEARSEEKKSDDATAKRRKQANRKVDELRTGADHNSKSEAGSPAAKNLARERLLLDSQMLEERQEADKTIERERESMTKRADEFFRVERLQTDEDLRHERTVTDEASQVAARKLAHELSEHAFTKRAVTTRDEFVSIVSHDLRSPLSIIMMYADELAHLLRSPSERNEASVFRAIDAIRRQTTNMNLLILDLLDVEHMASGTLGMNREKCDLTVLLRDILRGFDILAKKKNITVSEDIPALTCSVHFDADRIRQVVSNLLSNAIKFTPAEGQIRLVLKEGAEGITVSVIDTGTGIPVDRRETIFERFSQLRKNDRSGVGLGLYIARWIVEAHNGKIFVQDNPAHSSGSDFTFTLPKGG